MLVQQHASVDLVSAACAFSPAAPAAPEQHHHLLRPDAASTQSISAASRCCVDSISASTAFLLCPDAASTQSIFFSLMLWTQNKFRRVISDFVRTSL
jgi:hypothetical protein